LAKEPEDRFPNAEAFVTALDNFDSQQHTINISQSLPTKPPKKSFVGGYKKSLLASGLVLALAAGIYLAVDSPFSSKHISSVIDLRALPPAIEDRNPIAARYEDFAIETLEEGNLQQSLALIDIGLGSVPKDPRLVALRERVENLLTANGLLKEAQQLKQQGDLAQSLSKIQEGLRLAPNFLELVTLREQVTNLQLAKNRLQAAQQLQQQGDLAQSLSKIQEGLNAVPDHSALVKLGEKVQTQLTNQKKAHEFLQQAQQQFQDRAYEQSLNSIEKGLQHVLDNADLLALRDEVKAQIKLEQEVDELVEQVQKLEQSGALVEALVILDGGQKRIADHPKILALRDRVGSALARQQEANDLLQQAQQHYQDGNLQASLDSIEQGLKLLPQQTNLLALQEEVQSQWEQQQAKLAETQRRQQEADDLLQQAKKLYQNGELEKTLVAIEEGLEQISDHPDLRALRDKVQTTLASQQEADALLQQAKQVWQNGDLDKSLALIEEGLLLVPEQSDLVSLREQIEQQLAVQNEVAELLKNCQRYTDFNALDPEQMAPAVACYRTVLERQPDHPEAGQAIQKLTDHYMRLTEQAITEGAEKQAENYLNEFEELDLTHAQLSSLKERLKTLTEESLQANSTNQLAELLRECAAHLQANRLTTGQGGTALACYTQVLREDPNNTDAQNGLEQIASKYAGWAAHALSRNDDSRAQRHLQRLAQVDPQHPRLAMLRNELQVMQETRQRQAEEAQRQAEEAQRQQQLRQAAARQQRQRVDLLLSQAQRRYANGAFRESLALVDQGLELAPDHNRLQTLRQEIQAKLAEAAKPQQPPESLSSEDDENTRPRKRIFGTF
jgi:tetratricopeptide (TPR) repeat protein